MEGLEAPRSDSWAHPSRQSRSTAVFSVTLAVITAILAHLTKCRGRRTRTWVHTGTRSPSHALHALTPGGTVPRKQVQSPLVSQTSVLQLRWQNLPIQSDSLPPTLPCLLFGSVRRHHTGPPQARSKYQAADIPRTLTLPARTPSLTQRWDEAAADTLLTCFSLSLLFAPIQRCRIPADVLL